MQEKLFNMVNKYDKFIEVLDWYKSERRQVGGTSHYINQSSYYNYSPVVIN
jgi:hypothetical protein